MVAGTAMTHHQRADPWLLVACVVGALALVMGWRALMDAMTESVNGIFGGIGR